MRHKWGASRCLPLKHGSRACIPYPDVKIEIYPEALDETNAINLLERFDLVIDGTDNFATKFLINAAARKVGIPMIYGAVTGFEGEVALFGGDSACYRCLRSAPPQAPIQNCAEAGVLGSVVGVIGTMQATLALEFILSRGESHSLSPQKGSLTLVDLRGSWKIQTLKIPRHPACPICSVAQKEVILPSSLPEICSNVSSITARELQARMSTPHQRLCLIDVRELPEWSEGHLEGARFFPLSKIQSGELPSFPPETSQIVLYCQKGVRSAKAAELLAEKGTRNVWHLTGGLESWQGPLIRSS